MTLTHCAYCNDPTAPHTVTASRATQEEIERYQGPPVGDYAPEGLHDLCKDCYQGLQGWLTAMREIRT